MGMVGSYGGRGGVLNINGGNLLSYSQQTPFDRKSCIFESTNHYSQGKGKVTTGDECLHKNIETKNFKMMIF